MFVRNVSMNVKPNSIEEFSKSFNTVILPLLRKQPGFCEAFAYVNESATHITGISNRLTHTIPPDTPKS